MRSLTERRRSLGLLVGVAVALAAGGAACSADDAGGEGAVTTAATATTAPVSTTSTTTIEDVEADVAAAQTKAVESYYRAMEDPDPDDPLLEVHRSGQSLEDVRTTMQELRDAGQVLQHGPEGPPVSTVETVDVDVDAGTAEVVSCVVDQSILVEAATRSIVNDDIAGSRQRYFLERQDETWLIIDIELVERFEGATSCAP